jgi:type IV pilus assembly protein PilA
MKPDFQAKFLQHLNKKKQSDEGFTLIELLVVIIIIGILAAIALPSLLAQVNKAKQAEAKQNVGALNRAQQGYFLENSCFVAGTLSTLGVGIKSTTVNYNYSITGDGTTCPQLANNKGVAKPNSKTLKSYLGLNTTLKGDPVTSELLSLGFVCETLQPSTVINDAAVGTTSCDPAVYKDLGGRK